MAWNGMENLDLSGVTVKQGTSILGVGRHAVKVIEAGIKTDEVKKTHTLEVKYENDKGVITQWIILNHPTSTDSVRIGMEQLKQMLVLMGHEGSASPAPSWLVGKAIGVSIKDREYNGKTQTRVNYHYALSDEELEKLGGKSATLDDAIPF